MNLGFLGGTGIEAKGLALRFAAAGASAILGSRLAERAQQAAVACNAILGRPLIRGLGNPDMLQACDVIFFTIPFAQAAQAADSCRCRLNRHHVIVDVTVPMVFHGGHPEYVEQEGGSNSEIIASHLPEGVPLVAAFKTIPAFILAEIGTVLNCDLLVCSDAEAAKRTVMEVASLIPSLRPLDGGPLRAARTLERMAALAVGLNRRYKSKGARFRVEGI